MPLLRYPPLHLSCYCTGLFSDIVLSTKRRGTCSIYLTSSHFYFSVYTFIGRPPLLGDRRVAAAALESSTTCLSTSLVYRLLVSPLESRVACSTVVRPRGRACWWHAEAFPRPGPKETYVPTPGLDHRHSNRRCLENQAAIRE